MPLACNANAQRKSPTDVNFPLKPSAILGTSNGSSSDSPRTVIQRNILAEITDLNSKVPYPEKSKTVDFQRSTSDFSGKIPRESKESSSNITISSTYKPISKSETATNTEKVEKSVRINESNSIPSSSDNKSSTSNYNPANIPIPGNATIEALKRELFHVTETYGILIKEHRMLKAETERTDRAQKDEISKLRTQLHSNDRSRRELSDVLSSLKSTKEELQAARTREQEALDRCETYRRARDTAEHKKNEYFAKLKELEPLAKRGSTADGVEKELDLLRHETKSLRKERDALLDFIKDSRSDLSTLSDLKTSLSDKEAECRRIQNRYEDSLSLCESQEARIAELLQENSVLSGSASQLPRALSRAEMAEAAVEELKLVQKDLLERIQLSLQENAEKQKKLDYASRDEKRIQRLERALDAYRAVEAVFARRTGQGFFGVNGLAYDLTSPTSIVTETSNLLSPRRSSVSEGASAVPSVGDPSLVSDFLDSVVASAKRELQEAHEAELARERAEGVKRVAAAERRMVQFELAANEAASARAAAEARTVQLEALEASIADLMRLCQEFDHSHPVPAAGTSAFDVNGVIVEGNPLYTRDWSASPAFQALLPQVSSAVTRMRSDVIVSLRQRRLALQETQDLREELAAVKGGDLAAAVAHRVAAADVRETLRQAAADREQLRADCAALRARTAELESQLVEQRTRAAAAEGLRDAVQKDHASLAARLSEMTAMLAQNQAALAQSRAEEGAAIRRWKNAKTTNQELLTLLGNRDSALLQLKLKYRQLKAVASKSFFNSQSKENMRDTKSKNIGHEIHAVDSDSDSNCDDITGEELLIHRSQNRSKKSLNAVTKTTPTENAYPSLVVDDIPSYSSTILDKSNQATATQLDRNKREKKDVVAEPDDLNSSTATWTSAISEGSKSTNSVRSVIRIPQKPIVADATKVVKGRGIRQLPLSTNFQRSTVSLNSTFNSKGPNQSKSVTSAPSVLNQSQSSKKSLSASVGGQSKNNTLASPNTQNARKSDQVTRNLIAATADVKKALNLSSASSTTTQKQGRNSTTNSIFPVPSTPVSTSFVSDDVPLFVSPSSPVSTPAPAEQNKSTSLSSNVEMKEDDYSSQNSCPRDEVVRSGNVLSISNDSSKNCEESSSGADKKGEQSTTSTSRLDSSADSSPRADLSKSFLSTTLLSGSSTPTSVSRRKENLKNLTAAAGTYAERLEILSLNLQAQLSALSSRNSK